MTRSEIELIDGGNYGLVRKDRISSNQIKTRPASFNAISKVWNDFRLKFYTDRLNAEKESALTQKFDVDSESKLTNHAVEQINNKSLVIARLEEKIKILSKESVPANYVDNRAIKLRTKMMNNLVNNCGNAYSIGVDKMDEVFGSTVTTNEVVNSVPETINSETADIKDDVMPIDLTVGNAENNNVEEQEQVTPEVQTVNAEVVEQPSDTPEVQAVDSEIVEQSVETPEIQVVSDEVVEQPVDTPELQVVEQPVENSEIIKSDETISNNTLDVVPLDVTPVGETIDRSDIKDAINLAFNNEEAVETPTIEENTNENVDTQSDDSAVADYEVSDDALVFDNDEPALFELINPNDDENVIVTDVKTDYDSNVSDTPVISDSIDEDINVSKNGVTKAKIDKYKDIEQRKTPLKPFKVVTFKDIFRPSEQKFNEDNIALNVTGAVGNSIDDVRYVPIIVPERSESQEKVNVVDNSVESSVTVSNVENMKNQYLQLQKLLRSKTARLNSVRAEREAVKTEVETSSKDKANATADLNEKYQLMAKYIGDLQRQCAIVDDETASNENDINNDRRTIEDNRQAVISTQRAIKDLDDILRDSISSYDDEDNYVRRVA